MYQNFPLSSNKSVDFSIFKCGNPAFKTLTAEL